MGLQVNSDAESLDRTGHRATRACDGSFLRGGAWLRRGPGGAAAVVLDLPRLGRPELGYPPEWPLAAWLVKTQVDWPCEHCGAHLPPASSDAVLTVLSRLGLELLIADRATAAGREGGPEHTIPPAPQ